jgi:hypothetical protein
MTLDSLKNSNIHTFLIEEIRRKLTEMGKASWKIKFYWFNPLTPNDLQRRRAVNTLKIKIPSKKSRRVALCGGI